MTQLATFTRPGELTEAGTGYRRALVGRYVSGERLLRAELERASSLGAKGVVSLLLGLTARCRGDLDGALSMLRQASTALRPDEPAGSVALLLVCDSLAQAGRIDELRALLQERAVGLPASLADLCNAVLRVALGESREGEQLASAALKAGAPPELERWALAVRAEALLDRSDWATVHGLLAERAERELVTAFDECAVRLLLLDARAMSEPLWQAPGLRPSGAALAQARARLKLCAGYAANMPVYRLLASSGLGLLEARLGLDEGAVAVMAASEALEKLGATFEAGRVMARLARLHAVLQQERATPVVARARDLLVKSGAFSRLAALSAGENAAAGASVVQSMVGGVPRTTFGGGSLIGFELEKDVELQAVFEMARDVTSTRQVSEVLQRIVTSAVKVLKAERGALMRRHADGSLECVAGHGVVPSEVREGSQTISFSALRECERQQVAVLSDNALTDERFKQQGSVLASDLRSVACAPMSTAKQQLGFLYLDSSVKSRAFTDVTREMLGVFAAQAAVALENALAFEEIDGLTRGLEKKVVERTAALQAANSELERTLEDLKSTRLAVVEAQRDALEKEMKLARQIQMGSVPRRGRIETSAAVLTGVMEPASFCGGDFWSYGELDGGRTFFLVGDVTGHGVAAAMLTAVAKSCLDTLLSTNAARTPSEFLARLNDAIFESGKGELQMTAWMGVVDPAERKLTFANAAQPFPLYVDLSQKLPKLELCISRGDTLGEEKGATFKELTRPYTAGSVLVLYTDGLVECTDATGKAWGENKLRRLVAEQSDFGAEALREAITTSAWAHFGDHPRDDDVTVVVASLT